MQRRLENLHADPPWVPGRALGRARGACRHTAAAALLLFLAFLVGVPATASAGVSRTPRVQITAPAGGGSYEAGSALAVRWTATGLTPGGSFSLCVANRGHALTEVVLPAGRGPAYTADLVLAVPPGDGYSIIVGWRPATETTGWRAFSRSAGTFSVIPAPPPSPDKALTSFGFAGLTPPIEGVIDEAAHSIALTVPSDTAVGALVASFTTTGVLVSVGGLPQISGFTVNDFTSPITYRVTAGDDSTQDYVVTVTAAPGIQVGDHYGGGIVAWIWQGGDSQYRKGEVHGVIISEESLGTARWGLLVTVGTEAKADKGPENTDKIIARFTGARVPQDTYAAGIARAYRGGGFSDWYLPSKDELSWICGNRNKIHGLHGWLWSSTEYGPPFAWARYIESGSADNPERYGQKDGHTIRQEDVVVRACRRF